MNILFIASGNHGAISPVVRNQAEALISEGVSVEYYLINGKGIRGYLRNIKPLKKYLKEHKYDAIHTHFSLTAFVASLAGAKSLVVSLMGDDVKASKWYKFIIRVFAFLFRWEAIIVKSNDMYRDLGMEQAIIIPNGVNLERFKPMSIVDSRKYLGWDPEKKHILFPADATRPVKDYPLAEAAIALLNDKMSSVTDRSQNETRTLNDMVELHAFENTPNEETPYWYNAADAVLMTSKWEGSPNAIKEAMACSRPIVTTNVGDVAERMCGVEGCYVITKDDRLKMIDELAKAVEKALTFKETKGRERIIADGLDRHEINQKLMDVYR